MWDHTVKIIPCVLSSEETQPQFKWRTQSSETTTANSLTDPWRQSPGPTSTCGPFVSAFTQQDGTDPQTECSAPLVAEEPRGAQRRSGGEPLGSLLRHDLLIRHWLKQQRHASSISLRRKGSQKIKVTAFSRFTGLFWFAAGFKTNCERNNYCGEREVVDYRCASLFCQISGKLAAPLLFFPVLQIKTLNRSYNSYFTPNSEHS